jgi:hypothetical protein
MARCWALNVQRPAVSLTRGDIANGCVPLNFEVTCGVTLGGRMISWLKFDNAITLFEIISLAGVAAAVFTFWDQGRTRRAEFSLRIWEAFTRDDVQTIFLRIDYGKFSYGAPDRGGKGFASSVEERAVDRLLYLFDELALLSKSGILRRSDRERWRYQGQRVFQNSAIKEYLDFLGRFYQANTLRAAPHHLAREIFS